MHKSNSGLNESYMYTTMGRKENVGIISNGDDADRREVLHSIKIGKSSIESARQRAN